MFGPKRTFESVVGELVQGFRTGEVRLQEPELTGNRPVVNLATVTALPKPIKTSFRQSAQVQAVAPLYYAKLEWRTANVSAGG